MANRLFCLLVAVVSGCALSPATFAQKHWAAPRVVTWNCSGCHGIDGNAQPPYVPRLAGLDAKYTEQRMKEFGSADPSPVDDFFLHNSKSATEHVAVSPEARTNMIGIARAMTSDQMKEAAAWYAVQTPGHGRSGRTDLIERGESMYLKGLPDQGMAPCQTCHGADAKGKARVPRLAGQNGPYILAELEKFKTGDRKHAPEMTMVAQHVEPDQFRALAVYLESR